MLIVRLIIDMYIYAYVFMSAWEHTAYHKPYTIQLDMSTARRRMKSPRSLSGTSAHPTMVTLVNIMVLNGWLTSFSFYVNWSPHSWDIAISDSDLATPRSRSWVWSRDNVILSTQCHINSLPFHFTSDQQFLRYSNIEIWPWNIQGQGHEWGQRSRSHIIPIMEPMHFLSFHINRTNHSWDMAKKKICKNNSNQHNCSNIWSGNNHD